MRTCSQLVCCFEELRRHLSKDFAPVYEIKFQFLQLPLLYFESIILAMTLKRAVLQESVLSYNAKCDSRSL
jgi:hypothetical protein